MSVKIPFVINQRGQLKEYWAHNTDMISQIIRRKEAEFLAGGGVLSLVSLLDLEKDDQA